MRESKSRVLPLDDAPNFLFRVQICIIKKMEKEFRARLAVDYASKETLVKYPFSYELSCEVLYSLSTLSSIIFRVSLFMG